MPSSQNNSPRLREERQFNRVLIGTCVGAVGFVFLFILLTLIKSARTPDDITANWFAAWGTWAGGLATGAAFLIAAFSIAVASAHARVDREDAARVRESEDMAQARLLIIYRVETPTIPRSMVTYRIENRSKDIFFDVSVPYVDRQNDSGDGMGRTTPEEAESSMQYLPRQELLTPYRTATEDEGWFTQVVVYTSDWNTVRFTVHYTDATGRQWKQHLGGKIEREFSSEAVPVREADRFQPPSQIRRTSAAEARELGLGDADDHDWTKLDTITDLMATTWRPAGRVGRPNVSANTQKPGWLRMNVSWSPTGPPPWWKLFAAKLRESFPFQTTGEQGDVKWVFVDCREDDLERVVGAVDEAIEYANNQFEESVIKPLRAAQADVAASEKAAAEHQARLDERAARLERPGGPAPRPRGRPRRQEPSQDRDGDEGEPENPEDE
jgi:hypothetical protein